MAISPETVEEVNRVANVYDVISDYLSLKRQGSVYVALCPFHNEKTPSFVVSPTKNIFKCFGCGISGNAIKFVMEYEKISYFDAVVKLAQKYNIPVKYLDSEKEKLNKGLYAITRMITEFYKENLKKSQICKDYLKNRGILSRTIEEFELGYSPEDSSLLQKYIQEKNISVEDLEKIGLITKTDNGFKDKFSGRLIFPIKDIKGNIIAFGGRALDSVRQPKYLNSPETVIYKKRNTLYGIYESLEHLKEKQSVVIVEGYMDLISLFQIGIKNVVATLGTAFTKNQANLLKKYIKEAVVMFDSDEAGKKAAIETAKILLSEGITVRYAYYKEAKDPDELSKQGLSKVKEIIDRSKDIIIFLLERLKSIQDSDIKTQLKNYQTIYNYITKIIAYIEDPSLRNSYIEIVAKYTGRAFANVESDIEKVRLLTKIERENLKYSEDENKDIKPKLSIKEKIVLKHILENPNFLQKYNFYDIITFSDTLGYYIQLINSGNTQIIQDLSQTLNQHNISTTEETVLQILEDFRQEWIKKQKSLDLSTLSEKNFTDVFNEIKTLKRRR
ncbi:DNA primase [Sulfurihydrogenibium subterraneum]|uniref:DNA primase n=1 Tax=Sulfurihydrogenibium subterraneum TaxID=171121 RepID=UPI000490ABDE|nr:DNA primase [Sulfurihydrogenibium subterraneum]